MKGTLFLKARIGAAERESKLERGLVGLAVPRGAREPLQERHPQAR